MIAFTLIAAFFAPIFWRVFWKSFDEIGDLEDRALRNLPRVVDEVLATLFLSGILALVLYNYVELSIETTVAISITAGAVFMRLDKGTFDSRLIGRIIGWCYWGAVSLKAKYIR
ncbi:hypothetical protein IC232_03870 [Microvirga sp. BT688]|uniref:hypothetical protein n=1 Tax=Microvirga sp. TaxID=1873136 RepID=UPI0016865CB9|nr:hypothetical protein [Microvirga sp.]MBD2745829.1 hypothetical protein [Microvirga sp.]